MFTGILSMIFLNIIRKKMHPQIILASQSPRRKQLLEWAEINFEIIIQPTDESFPAALPPAEIAMHIAANKALAVKKIYRPKMKE